MFFDRGTKTVFDGTGFSEAGGIWLWDTQTRRERWISVPGGSRATVWKHQTGLMRVRYGDVISIRACAEPEVELSRFWAVGDTWRFEGDSDLWSEPLPFLVKGNQHHTDLVVVDGKAEIFSRHKLSWFFDGDYDFGYQGPTECLAMPAIGVVFIAIARSHVLVSVDIRTGLKVGELHLAGHGGAGHLQRVSDTTFLATDYDVMCLIDATSGLIKTSQVLQRPKRPNTAQFIGGYDSESVLAVARPFNRDVLKLDKETFEVVGRSRVLRRPIDVCMISEDRFVTRAWKTGKVSVGVFRHS
jgi:hypothetical protein